MEPQDALAEVRCELLAEVLDRTRNDLGQQKDENRRLLDENNGLRKKLRRLTRNLRILADGADDAEVGERGGAPFDNQSDAEDVCGGDDDSEPEQTVSSVSWNNHRATRASKCVYKEAKVRAAYFEETGRKFMFGSQVLADMRSQGDEHAPEYKAKVEKRNTYAHDLWFGEDPPSDGAAVQAQASNEIQWPENIKVKEMQECPPAEHQRLATFCVFMRFKDTVEGPTLQGVMSNNDLEVANVRLGRDHERTQIATVAFNTQQHAQRAMELWQQQLLDPYAALGISSMDPYAAQVRANKLRFWFKNHNLADSGMVSEDKLRSGLGNLYTGRQSVNVQVRSYWDNGKQAEQKTNTIFTGFVEFPEQSHADTLLADLKEERAAGRIHWVLKRIPGIPVTVAFTQDGGC